MLLQRWPIGQRLTIVLAIILGLSVLSSIVSVVKLRQLGQLSQSMVEGNLKTERAVADWQQRTVAGIVRATAVARTNDAGLAEHFGAVSAKVLQEVNALHKQIEQSLKSPAETALFGKINEVRKTYLTVRGDITQLKKAGDLEGAMNLFKARFSPAADAYLQSIQQLLDLQRAEFDAANNEIAELRSTITRVLIATSTIALGLGAWLAWAVTRSITRPLAQAQSAARSIAAMDLSGAAQSNYANDETGQLMRAIDTMRAALRDALGQVRGAVESISTASGEIAAGTQDLSSRTEKAASNLQQTASAMEELTGTVQHSASSAGQANQLASSAADVARRGGEVVGQVVRTMNEINDSSKRIADIIGTIDGIAFQTNILALNAAVEAARAGEQGRGFAVVASEVRGLAQRSAEAAREIKGLIGTSVERVADGSRLVDEAGRTMDQIVAGVQRVTDIIGEVSAASHEQSQGIGQVNGAVNELDRMTQQNAALVEQSMAAASSLSDQAGRLRSVVATFRLA